MEHASASFVSAQKVMGPYDDFTGNMNIQAEFCNMEQKLQARGSQGLLEHSLANQLSQSFLLSINLLTI